MSIAEKWRRSLTLARALIENLRNAGASSPEEVCSAIKMAEHLRSRRLAPPGLHIIVDHARATATLSGSAASIAERDRIFAAALNMPEVDSIIDRMQIAPQESLAETLCTGCSLSHTVRDGDSLQHIAQHYYGDGARYTEILAANPQVLQRSEGLFPGQILRIPQAG